MSEIFKTTLILSVLGTLLTLPLLAIKPITSKRFPAIWQYFIWIAVMLSMLVPIYKIVPTKEPEIQIGTQQDNPTYVIPIVPVKSTLSQPEQAFQPSDVPLESESENTTAAHRTPEPSNIQSEHKPDFQLNIPEYVAYIWFSGVCIGLTVIMVSYAVYLRKRRKNSVEITNNIILEQAKKELNIKRNIRIRMTSDPCSPMLVGILFPVIYIPCSELSDENLKMVFLHELTHYKRRDLAFKWLSLFVNVLHWFNPFAYLLCANLSEACEISCDMAVTKKMSDSEQKLYMKTILDLVE